MQPTEGICRRLPGQSRTIAGRRKNFVAWRTVKSARKPDSVIISIVHCVHTSDSRQYSSKTSPSIKQSGRLSDQPSRSICRNSTLETGERVLGHEKLYQGYFTIKTTPKRGTRVEVKKEAIQEAKRYYGFFALSTNEPMDAVTALELYRNKDVVEKAFGNLKERLNMRRTLVSSEQSLDGKLFVQFVALIYLSYIKKQMQEEGLFKNYTVSGLLDKLDVIECFEQPGKALRVGEILDAQAELYYDLWG